MQPQSHSSCVGSIRKYFNLDLLFCLLFSTQPQAASKIFSSKVLQSLPLTYGRSSPFFSFTPISSIEGLIVLFWLLLCCKRQWISISHLFLFVFCGRSMILEGSTVSLVTCLMLSSVTLTECPTLTALLCQPFPSSVTPLWMRRGQNCMHCSRQHHYRLFGSIITGSFCPLFAVSAQQIFIFFTVSANWDGVSMDMCIVTQRSHLWKTVATDLETHHWTGKTRTAFSLMHSFTFAYIKISSVYSVTLSCPVLLQPWRGPCPYHPK